MVKTKGNATHEMDMLHGPLTGKIVRFSAPLALSGILQLLYNAADIIVVGRFASTQALAAVTSTGALINLIVNLLMGLSVGTSVVVANDYGAGKLRDVRETVHTSILISLLGGILVGAIGFMFSGTFLSWMGSPDDVIGMASLYLRIYFIGMPFNMLFNFGASVLRALGDTKRPLYYLSISGAVNVVLNLLLVIVFKLDVAGVAIATITSQAISAVLIIACMMRSDGACNFNIREMCLHMDKFVRIVKVGLPAGIQGSLFSISNVMIQSTINSFGSTVIAANGASGNLEGFVYTAMNSVYQAALAFTGQNMGARKYARIRRIVVNCLAVVTVIGLGLGGIIYLFMDGLLGIYSSEPMVIEFARVRLTMFCYSYFTCGLMDVMVGHLRGLGYSILPMIVSLVGVCGLRLGWIFLIFPMNPTLDNLYLSYPLSWIVTFAAHFICFLFAYRKVMKRTDGDPSLN